MQFSIKEYSDYLDGFEKITNYRHPKACPGGCGRGTNHKSETGAVLCPSCFKLMQWARQMTDYYKDVEMVYLTANGYLNFENMPKSYFPEGLDRHNSSEYFNKLISIVAGGSAKLIKPVVFANREVSSKKEYLRNGSDTGCYRGSPSVVATKESMDAAKELQSLLWKLIKAFGKFKKNQGQNILQQMAEGFMPEAKK